MKSIWLAAVSPVGFASTSFAQPAAQPPTSNLEKLQTLQSTSPKHLALAADAKAGRQKITVSQACHGLDRLSKKPESARTKS